MPWSTWTTRSPGVRPAASVRKFSARLRRRGGADQPVAEHVLLGDDRQARRLEAVLERPDGEAEAPGRLASPSRSAALAISRGVGDAAVGEQPGQPLARAGGIARDDDVALAAPRRDMRRERAEQADLLLLPLGREVAADAPAGVDHPGPERLRQRAELVQRGERPAAASQAASSR